MQHPYGSPKDCPWRGIIIRVIYMFTRLQMTCPFFPPTLDLDNTDQLRQWLSNDPGEYNGFPFHNGLKIFLWIVYDYYGLPDVYT